MRGALDRDPKPRRSSIRPSQSSRPLPPGRLLAVALALLAGAGPSFALDGVSLDGGTPDGHEELAWTRLAFRASKLGIAIEPKVRLELVPREAAATTWEPAPPDRRPIPPPGDPVARLTLDTRFLGRESSLILWFDPTTGQAVQREQVETGSKDRRRIYRFTRDGAARVTWGERTTGAAGGDVWSDRHDAWEAFPDGLGERPVVETSALLHLISRADLDETGEQLVVLAFTKGQVLEVTARVEGWVSQHVDYRLSCGPGESRIHGKRSLIRLSLSGRPAGEPDRSRKDEPLELLGLHGEIAILVDPEYRVPVALEGRIAFFGKVRVRLREADLAAPAEPREITPPE